MVVRGKPKATTLARDSNGKVTIVMGPEFNRVVKALRELDDTLPGQLRKGIRDAVKPAVRKAQANVRALPVKGRGHTGLRRKVASGVRVQVSLGSDKYRGKIRVVTSVPEADLAAIPRGFNSEKGFRHPVFGNRDEWVQQRPIKPGWFTDPMMKNRDDIRKKIKTLLDEAAQKVADAGGH